MGGNFWYVSLHFINEFSKLFEMRSFDTKNFFEIFPKISKKTVKFSSFFKVEKTPFCTQNSPNSIQRSKFGQIFHKTQKTAIFPCTNSFQNFRSLKFVGLIFKRPDFLWSQDQRFCTCFSVRDLAIIPPPSPLGPKPCYSTPSRVENVSKYLVLNGVNIFPAPSAPEKYPCIPIFPFLLQFLEKNPKTLKNNFDPHTQILIFISFLRNNY